MDEARLMLNKLLAAQECEWKEMEEQMAEKAHHLNNFQVSYQRLVDDSRESEVITNDRGKTAHKSVRFEVKI